MAIPPKPTVRVLPTAPTTADQGTFPARAEAWAPELSPFGQELSALAGWTGDRATSAETAQAAAESSQGAAASSATAAANSADAAANSATASETFKGQAETAAAAAAAGAGLPSLAGNAGNVLKVVSAETGVEWATALEFQEFTTSGTWAKLPGVEWVMVELVAGGQGGGARSGGTAISAGSGGMACRRLFPASAIGATEPVTVGAGGTGGSATGGGNASAAGSVGGQSSFGSHISTITPSTEMRGVAFGGSGNPTIEGGGSSGSTSQSHGDGGANVSASSAPVTGGVGEQPGGAGGFAATSSTGTATGGNGGAGVVRVWQW